jgi:hypothetical protein
MTDTAGKPQRTPRDLTPDQRAQRVRTVMALDGIRMGYTVAQMATYLEVNPSTIRRYLTRAAEHYQASHPPQPAEGTTP